MTPQEHNNTTATQCKKSALPRSLPKVFRCYPPAFPSVHALVLEVAPYFKDSVEFVFLENIEMSELQARIEKLPPRSLILLTVFNYDNTGRFFTYEESLAFLYPHAKAPMYSVWDFYLGGGIVGGMLTSGFQQGKTAGEIALRVLQG